MPSAGKRKKLHAMSKDIPEMFDPMSFSNEENLIPCSSITINSSTFISSDGDFPLNST